MKSFWTAISAFKTENNLGHLALPIAGSLLSLAIPGTRKEKLESLAVNLGTTALTFHSGWRGQLQAMLLGNAVRLPGMIRGMSTHYRAGLSARTSAAVPFSHSNIQMDLAFNCLNYGIQQSNSMGSYYGREGNYYSARYMNRNQYPNYLQPRM